MFNAYMILVPLPLGGGRGQGIGAETDVCYYLNFGRMIYPPFFSKMHKIIVIGLSPLTDTHFGTLSS